MQFIELTGYPKRWNLRKKKLVQKKKERKKERLKGSKRRSVPAERSFIEEEGIDTINAAKLTRRAITARRSRYLFFGFLKYNLILNVSIMDCKQQGLRGFTNLES